MDQYKNIQEALADLVPKKGKSNADVGKKLGGISGQRIGQYIAGRQKPKPDFIAKWKQVFGEDLNAIIETNVSHETKDEKRRLLNLDLTPYSEAVNEIRDKYLKTMEELLRLKDENQAYKARIDELIAANEELKASLRSSAGKQGHLGGHKKDAGGRSTGNSKSQRRGKATENGK